MAGTSGNIHVLGKAVVEFCQKGRYLDELDLSSKVERAELKDAYQFIGRCKTESENEIRTISKTVAPHVDTWIRHASSLQKDINESKYLEVTIRKNAKNGEEISRAAHDAFTHTEFLKKEINYNDILVASLRRIKSVEEDIRSAEDMSSRHDVMSAVKLLAEALRTLRSIPNYNRIRAFTLLEDRALDVKISLQKEFDVLWQTVVQVDSEKRSIHISSHTDDRLVDLPKMVLVMKYLDQTTAKVEALKNIIQEVIIHPRINLQAGVKLFSLQSSADTLSVSINEADRSIGALFEDLSMAIKFIVTHLPNLSPQLSKAILPELCIQLRETWLNAAIPTRISDMEPFRKAVGKVLWFEEELQSIGWNWTDTLSEWVHDCARIWMAKRRENDLVTVRDRLSFGLITKRKITRQEEQVIQTENDNEPSNSNEWDDDWDEDNDDKSESTDGTHGKSLREPVLGKDDEDATEDFDEGDAWGWGDDDPPTSDLPTQTSAEAVQTSGIFKTKTVLLKWHYLVSSMPEGVVTIIRTAINDGLALTQKEQADNPIAPAAIALFALPTLTLAMYRAISPYHYQNSEGGNMYLYNDALWLAEELDRISKEWNLRDDITPRAHGKVKFDSEVSSMQKFGKRAYAREITTQRTIIKDLLRGDQCFLSDEGVDITDDEASIDSVVTHVRTISSIWEPILARTNWAQAVGSLLSTIAEKIILDVLDISGLQADASYNIASLISKVVTLEDLFIPKNDGESNQLPITAVEYAPNWFKFQYLSEILQSNLEAVRYLWFEGEVSMFFTPEELVDLIELSFADSPRKTEIIRNIKNNQQPRKDLVR